MGGFLILMAFFGMVLLIWLFVDHLNRSRIDNYIAGIGGLVISISWRPFGYGWFGEKDSMIYEVRYRDREGNIHEAHCKTSMFSGVYFGEDRIIRRETPKATPPVTHTETDDLPWTPVVESPNTTKQSLTEENRRLREENRKLRDELAKRSG